MKKTIFCFLLAGSALAEPARATLRVYQPDRSIAVRAPSATATRLRSGSACRCIFSIRTDARTRPG